MDALASLRNGAHEAEVSPVDRWVALLGRRWRWGALVAAGVLATAAAVVLLSRPVYRADARIRLSEPPPQSGVSPSSVLNLFRPGGDPFSNDLELLASRTLAEGVVDDQALQVRLDAPPGRHRDSLLLALAADRSTGEAAFRVAWTGGGGVEVREEAGDTVVARGAAGEELRFGGVRVAVRPQGPGFPETFRLVTEPFGEAVRAAGSRLQVERTRREANVLELRWDDADPALARGVVASALARFVALRTRIQERESDETVDSLRVVARQTLAELTGAEQAIQDLQEATGMVAPEAQTGAAVERLSLLTGELERARAELALVSVSLEQVREATSPAEAWTTLVAHPRFMENEVMGTLLTRLTALEEARTELVSRRTAENREVAVVDRQIADLDAALRSLAGHYRDGLRQQVAALQEQADRLTALLATVPGQGMELARRQREARLLSEVLVVTEQRLRQEELRQALTFANVQVIDPPAVQYRPVWPRKKLGLAVGLLLAGLSGLLAMVVVERADGTARSGRHLRELAGVPVLAAPVTAGRNGRAEPATWLEPREAAAILGVGRAASSNGGARGATAGGRSGPALVLASVGTGSETAELVRGALARSLGDTAARAPGGNGAPGGTGGNRAATAPVPGGAPAPAAGPDEGLRVAVGPPLSSFPAALEAVGWGVPVVLVVRSGESRAAEVVRAARLLREAGGEPAGVVVVCRGDAEAREAWA